jgi:hypothetical protein
MITNLVIHDVNKWKDADDTIAEIVPRNNKSNAQIATMLLTIGLGRI